MRFSISVCEGYADSRGKEGMESSRCFVAQSIDLQRAC